ncbi:MAG: hypothetical protein R6V85_03905 [Polyangia bacterium]
MIDITDPAAMIDAVRSGNLSTDEMWLLGVNLALGLLCAAFVAIVIVGAGKELVRRHRQRAADATTDTHVQLVPGLGTVAADGGSPIEHETSSDENADGSRGE